MSIQSVHLSGHNAQGHTLILGIRVWCNSNTCSTRPCHGRPHRWSPPKHQQLHHPSAHLWWLLEAYQNCLEHPRPQLPQIEKGVSTQLRWLAQSSKAPRPLAGKQQKNHEPWKKWKRVYLKARGPK
ncbi:hypothetical protein H5410_061502 [Solanum commersonii]|uniref:Uncharacterized protein n=1 Tax=Solanum commersonii TaxID=4109 RepID=A0A9J5W9D8_SOLCO|nr:hypothetical protein H5410_061502 [Solanum commersonii]